MSELAIRVEGLCKRYRIGRREPYKALRETLVRAVASPISRLVSRLRATSVSEMHGGLAEAKHIWALKDVSFDVKQGEVVGIVGLNGAGKTTLLRILSRITEPTEGEAEIRGRVGSLLEVGTGFHPELTGLENIYLNGAILGMRRAEIDRKIDEIVAFAEIQKFVDTPIKHYSSGMYMRLAFAVAAHLDFEILLVDEVLAVGDLLFQKKCLNKMRDVSQEGRTVLFVSHNMAAIGMLTRSCLWLDRGRLVERGDTGTVIRRYSNNPRLYRDEPSIGTPGYADLRRAEVRHGLRKATEREVTFAGVGLMSNDGSATDTFYEGESIRVEFALDVRAEIEVIDVLCRVRRADGYLIFTTLTGKRWIRLDPGAYVTGCVFDPNHLRPGWYYLELSIVTGAAVAQDVIPEAIAFSIIGKVDEDGDPRYAREAMGVIRVEFPWSDFKLVDGRPSDAC